MTQIYVREDGSYNKLICSGCGDSQLDLGIGTMKVDQCMLCDTIIVVCNETCRLAYWEKHERNCADLARKKRRKEKLKELLV